MSSELLLYLDLILIISLATFCQTLKQCHPSIYSVYGHYLSRHEVLTTVSSSFSECVTICSIYIRCRSLNFRLGDKSCELNDSDQYTHPEDYGPRAGSVYMDTPNGHRNVQKIGFKSCGEIHQEWPQVNSGYFWIKIGDRDAQVYCDMENYGGGWTLVVSISSKNNDHLQRTANNCLNSILCVPFSDKNITSRKLGDEDLHKMTKTEGTFRVDILRNNGIFTTYFQIPSGPEKFNSTCSWGNCPRIIVSHSYPYTWETNHCTSIDVGYHIAHRCHSVFDVHDDGECGYRWLSSRLQEYGYEGRALYGYHCPGHPLTSLGIYRNQEGMLYVK